MYHIEIKPAARRHNGAVGETVNDEGTRHSFPDRAAAEAWAGSLSDAGDHLVWVQNAPPHADDDVDGYLMSRGSVRTAVAPFDSEQRELRSTTEHSG